MAPRTTAAQSAPLPAEKETASAEVKPLNKGEYDYLSMREAAKKGQFLCCIHGNVYDVTDFADKHPGGALIRTALARDATALYETHHNLLDMKKVNQILEKYRVGKLKDYKPIAKFDSPFATTMLARCREALKGVPHRDSLYANSAVVTILSLIGVCMYLSATWGSLIIAPFFGLMLAFGHLLGHAANHWSLSSNDTVSRILSITCTNFWGLYEKNWEFSHVISHHCYNYTDRDYVMDQHAPPQFYRVRPSDPWKPLHAYQHIYYQFSHIVAFFVGGLRLDCAPFIFVAPLLRVLRRNRDSPLPGPQFFASGSNAEIDELAKSEDGVGPEKFYIFYESYDHLWSIVLANIFWLPLFLRQWQRFGLLHAIAFNFCVFGVQAAFITRTLFTQHICEDIQLVDKYEESDCWYARQVSSSVTVNKSELGVWALMAACYQIEHHMFPCANPNILRIIRPIVKKTAEEFGVRYFEFKSQRDACASVYQHFKRLSSPTVTAQTAKPHSD